MHILRPLDSRASQCFRLLQVNWFNVHWKQVQSGILAVTLLERKGVAEMVLQRCAERLGESYRLWMDLLRQQVPTNTVSINSLRILASKTAKECHDTYIGTEHLMASCLKLDEELLKESVPNLAEVYSAEWDAFRRRIWNIQNGGVAI